MIHEISTNINTELQMLREAAVYIRRLPDASPLEREVLSEVLRSLQQRMKILNNALPSLIRSVTLAKPLSEKKVSLEVEKLKIIDSGKEISVTVGKKDRDAFLKELSISENALSSIKKDRFNTQDERKEFQRSRGYVKLANKIFFPYAHNFLKKGTFQNLSIDLKKANIDLLPESYLSITFLTTIIAFVIGLIFSPLVMIFELGIRLQLMIGIGIITIFPLIVYSALYFYPSAERDSIAKKIDQELPFAVIHMSAVSGAGIEPTNIFKIIGFSKEYPALRKEIRKVLNQINLYGYDLVTALNNIARKTPSPKLAELFLGLSTNISSGGSLSVFFEKRAETLLLNYRLEREKFTRMAETFMDIYITVVIAAPMILLLVFILLSIGDFTVGLSPQLGTFVLIGLVALINIIFLGIVHLKQPTY